MLRLFNSFKQFTGSEINLRNNLIYDIKRNGINVSRQKNGQLTFTTNAGDSQKTCLYNIHIENQG